MKKIYLMILAFAAISFGSAKAQNPTFSPGVFTAEDEVTLTIDVTGTPMAGQSEAYIWIFANVTGSNTNGFTNTSWTNSPASAKMTAAGTNKWSYKFTGTTMFSLTPGELKDFGFLVKAKDGSKQTQDYKPFLFDPLVFTPTMLRVFPSKVDKDDAVTVNFDKTLAATVNEQRMDVTSATITMFDEAGTQVGTPLTIPAKPTGDNIWSSTFIPSMSFTAATGHTLKKFTYKFNGTMKDTNGATTTVSSSEGSVEFVTLK